MPQSSRSHKNVIASQYCVIKLCYSYGHSYHSGNFVPPYMITLSTLYFKVMTCQVNGQVTRYLYYILEGKVEVCRRGDEDAIKGSHR